MLKLAKKNPGGGRVPTGFLPFSDYLELAGDVPLAVTDMALNLGQISFNGESIHNTQSSTSPAPAHKKQP